MSWDLNITDFDAFRGKDMNQCKNIWEDKKKIMGGEDSFLSLFLSVYLILLYPLICLELILCETNYFQGKCLSLARICCIL